MNSALESRPSSVRAAAILGGFLVAALAVSAVPATAAVGVAWEPRGLAGTTVADLAAHITRPGELLAALGSGAVVRSTDGGRSWTEVLPASVGVLGVVYSVPRPERAYAWSVPEGSVLGRLLTSGDRGRTWLEDPVFESCDECFLDRLPERTGDPVSSYLVEVWDPLLFPTDLITLWRTRDGGESWRAVWQKTEAEEVRLVVDPIEPRRQLVSSERGVERTVDDTANWQPALLGPELEEAWILGLSADSHVADRVIAIAYSAGIYESRDFGSTWARVGNGFSDHSTDLLFADEPGTVYASAKGDGLFVSHDGGRDFEPVALVAGLEVGPLARSLEPLTDAYLATSDGIWAAVRDLPPCTPADDLLCLVGDRFAVTVAWEDHGAGSGQGVSVPLTGNTGAFWFFREENLELMVKVLDGRALNGHWWVFFGSLSNVEFTLTVTDTDTEVTRTYENPARRFASRGDTTAFD